MDECKPLAVSAAAFAVYRQWGLPALPLSNENAIKGGTRVRRRGGKEGGKEGNGGG